MPYRDELLCAHRQIARLEGEIARLRLQLKEPPRERPHTVGDVPRWVRYSLFTGIGLAVLFQVFVGWALAQ